MRRGPRRDQVIKNALSYAASVNREPGWFEANREQMMFRRIRRAFMRAMPRQQAKHATRRFYAQWRAKQAERRAA